MERSKVLEEVQSIIREHLEDPAVHVTDRTVMEHVPDWDSVAHVRIIVAIEDWFTIRFEPDEYIAFEDVGGMVDRICDKIARRNSDASAPARSNLAG